MKHHTQFLLLLFLFTTAIQAQQTQALDVEKLDTYFQELESNNKFMGSVALMDNGGTIYQKAVGFADVATKSPNTPETIFRIGSITKVFTGTMIFQLVQEGKLSLDTKLSMFFPQLKNADKITIGQLLNHRSGIHNITDDALYGMYMTQEKTREQLLEIIGATAPDFEPDTEASYSNSAYILLSFIIEDLDNGIYAESLEKRITKPAGLENTRYGGKIDSESDEAYSYQRGGDPWSLQPETDMSIPMGAGAIVSTASDLNTFFRTLFTTDTLINADSREKMVAQKDGYGFGMLQMPFDEKTVYGHTGGIDGFRSISVFMPGEKIAATVLSNGTLTTPNEILINLLKAALGEGFEIPEMEAFEEITLKEENYASYEGTFATDQMPLKITTTVTDGKLIAQATGQGPLKLQAKSETHFIFEPAGIDMEFKNLKNGKWQTFILKQGGGTFTFTREN